MLYAKYVHWDKLRPFRPLAHVRLCTFTYGQFLGFLQSVVMVRDICYYNITSGTWDKDLHMGYECFSCDWVNRFVYTLYSSVHNFKK